MTALIFVFQIAFSQGGVLDDTFASGGKLYLDFGSYESEITSVITQPDKKIVAAGVFHNHGTNQKYFIVRYNVDGSVNSTFGVEGMVVNPFEERPRINSLLLQPDGKILAMGTIYSDGAEYSKSFLVRYNPNGTLDEDFGSQGFIINDASVINAFSLQADGAIVVATDLIPYTLNERKLIRYKSDGSIDSNFGINGVVHTTIGSQVVTVKAIVVQSDGKILVGGSAGDNQNRNVAVLRYENDGAIDPTFGTAGVKIIDLEPVDEVTAMKVQTNGNIVLSLSSYHIDEGVYVFNHQLACLMAEGDYDLNFGNNGIAKLLAPCAAMELQANGKIIVAGSYDSGIYANPVVIGLSRYQSNGLADPDFGNNGLVSTSTGNNTRGAATSVAIQLDGKIVVGATFSEAYLSSHPHTLVLRYGSGETLTDGADMDFQKNSFIAYPNPVKEVLNLDFNLSQPAVLSVSLYNVAGIKVANLLENKAFSNGFGTQQFQVPEHLPQGVYFLKITNRTNTTNIKLIK